MAVFLAAADESDGPDQRGAFLYGGFVAPVLYWMNEFGPAWQDAVLNGTPVLPYLHMVEIRSKDWRRDHGITKREGERRVDEATRVIRRFSRHSRREGLTQKLHFVRNLEDGGHFRDAFKTTRIARSSPQPSIYSLDPDYVGYLGFAYGALDWVHKTHPDAERVDFIIERKSGVSNRIPHFHETLAEGLRAKGEGHLVPLIGELNPNGGKDRAPLQAADVALWHYRRWVMGDATADDLRRLKRILSSRYMTTNGLTRDHVTGMARRAEANSAPSPFPPKRRIN